MTARNEQETTITFMRDDDKVRIYTSNTTHVARLRNLSSNRDYVTEIRGAGDWAEFEVSVENFKLFSAIRAKRTVSEANRAASAARFAEMRAGS